jgi:hypothetical protein
MKKLIMGMLLTALPFASVMAEYDILDRAKLVEDRLNVLDLTRPIGHDFFIDVQGQFTTDIMDLQKDSEEISKIDDTQTIQVQVGEANASLEKYYDKEQVISAKVGVGTPLPSFTAWGTKIKPNFRIHGDIFAMLTPSQQDISLTILVDSLENVPSNLKTVVKNCILAGGMTDGVSLLDQCKANSSITQSDYDQLVAAYPGIEKVKYQASIGSTSIKGPAIDIYAKLQGKVGLFNTYKYDEHIFGTFNLYGLLRQDIKKRADALVMLSDSEFEYAENRTTNMVIDYSLGYTNDNYKVIFGIEELKIAEGEKPEDAELNYGDDMLMRLHAQAEYNLSMFKVNPYLGSHSRAGYSFGDAYYLGADWSMMSFSDRLGITLKTQMDKEHYTLGARMKIWVLHADVTVKQPRVDKVDGVKVGDFMGANIRIFF